MTRDDFWRLIAKKRGNLDRFTSALDKQLKSLAAKEIEDFARHYAELQNEANTTGILEAAYIIGCGASNDGFVDFRRWIVFQGETHFSNIIDNPDYLGGYDRKADPIEQWYCEYDPMGVYEEATGKELPCFSVAVYPDAASDFDKPTILAKRYPRLWKRIQAKESAQQLLSNQGQALFLDATLDRVEDDNGIARFVFSTGAEIHIRDYWEHYRTRYQIAADTPCYDEHPMLGKSVVSIKTDYFPSAFSMWFENRKKLSLRCDQHDCSDFDVFDNGSRVNA